MVNLTLIKSILMMTLLGALLSSCGNQGIPFIPKRLLEGSLLNPIESGGSKFQDFESTDPEFLPYLSQFEAYSLQYAPEIGLIDAHNVMVNFYDRPFEKGSPFEGKLAICFNSETLSSNQIYVNRHSWVDLDDLEKELLIFHELGHCKLGRDHHDAVNSCGHNLSIMSTYLINGNFYRQFKKELLTELFKRDQKVLEKKILLNSSNNSNFSPCHLH